MLYYTSYRNEMKENDITPCKELVEKVENKSEKELKLEELIGKLSSQLEEAQTELKSIK